MIAIIEMLNRLAEKAPDMCNRINEFSNDFYDIGPYRFGILSDGTLQGSTGRSDEIGRPAIAWLADAIMRECEKRGWDFNLELRPTGFGCDIGSRLTKEWFYIMPDREYKATLPEALLAAFLAAIEGER